MPRTRRLAGISVLPRSRRVGGWRAFFAFAFRAWYSLLHCFKCSFHEGPDISLYSTSTIRADVARLIPTYNLRRQNMGESVSASLTRLGKVSPCTEA